MSQAEVRETETLIPAAKAATLVDPTAYADGRIHETYAWLRGHNPFGRTPCSPTARSRPPSSARWWTPGSGP